MSTPGIVTIRRAKFLAAEPSQQGQLIGRIFMSPIRLFVSKADRFPIALSHTGPDQNDDLLTPAGLTLFREYLMDTGGALAVLWGRFPGHYQDNPSLTSPDERLRIRIQTDRPGFSETTEDRIDDAFTAFYRTYELTAEFSDTNIIMR